MVWEICFPFLLSVNGDEIGLIGSLHDGFNGGGIYDASNLLGASAWKFRFPDGDTEAEIVPSSWNDFLRLLFRFVVIRSNHDERLVRLNMFFKVMAISLGMDRLGSVFLLHR